MTKKEQKNNLVNSNKNDNINLPKDKILLNPQDIMAITGFKYDHACKMIREYNKELKAKGFKTYQGKVLKRYFLERLGGEYASI